MADAAAMSPGAVLVTGARGYLGGRLVRDLVARGCGVIGASRSAAPPPPGWPEGARLIALDPSDDPAVTAPKLGGVRAVVHLSAANELRSATDPDAAVRETGLGTRRLLEAAVQAGVGRFVFMSTIHVYGAPLRGALTEATLPRPAHPYAISHKLGEDFVLAAHDARRLEGVVVRLSNGIGAPAWTEVDRWSLVGNDLARQAVQDGEIVLKSPAQWRDFITLGDVCAGLNVLLDASPSDLGDGVFNLGGALPLRVMDVAERLAQAAGQLLGGSVPIRLAGPAEGDAAPPFRFEIDRIKALGFAPGGRQALDGELADTLRLLLPPDEARA